MSYKVKLESFEGPLDLLLFLIKKEEIDIYDIPISMITQQYLQYIEIIQYLDLESASDFILMAATLMRIKAQMLLPKPSLETEEDIEDPRRELVERLLEYKRFKEVAVDLGDKEKLALKQYPRGSFELEENGFDEEFLTASDVTLFDLVAAFKSIIEESKKKITVHRIEEINVTLEERVAFVQKKIAEKSQITFRELFISGEDKTVLIVTFIAILQLIKNNIILAFQEEPFAEILLKRA